MNDEVKKVIGEMRDSSDTMIGGRTITTRNFVSQEKCEEWANRLEAALKKDAALSDSGLRKVIKMARECCDDNERHGDYVVATETMRAYLDWIEGESRAIADYSVLKRFIFSLIRSHYEPDEAVVEKYGVDDFKHTCDEVSKWFDEHGDSQLASFVKVLNGDDKNTFVPM